MKRSSGRKRLTISAITRCKKMSDVRGWVLGLFHSTQPLTSDIFSGGVVHVASAITGVRKRSPVMAEPVMTEED